MISLVTSLNAIFAWCTRGLYMATEDGWLPAKLAAVNRFGTPYIFLTVFFVVGVTPILTGMTLNYVAILGNAVGAIFGLFPVLSLYNLAKRNPGGLPSGALQVARIDDEGSAANGRSDLRLRDLLLRGSSLVIPAGCSYSVIALLVVLYIHLREPYRVKIQAAGAKHT